MPRGGRTNRLLIPQARAQMERFKQEVASELGISNYSGYLGDLPSKVNGSVGGLMVKKMIAAYEQTLTGTAAGGGLGGDVEIGAAEQVTGRISGPNPAFTTGGQKLNINAQQYNAQSTGLVGGPAGAGTIG
ncbi:MAG TPA: hypothetical protein DEA73_00510 [Peptococcaceae bacterium]|nr:MAG: Small acid-soluble spore protein, alpha/beta type [Moorella sp. 60_41]HBT46354.1 hypothetical protein [Peptococcaceae bacterium]